MIIDTLTVSALQASVILYQNFGELRAWPDFLMDNIRHRQSIKGLTLMPCAKKKGRTGLQTRYAVTDLTAFIQDVKAAVPEAVPEKMKGVTLAIDTCKPWRMNRFERNGGKSCARIRAHASTH